MPSFCSLAKVLSFAGNYPRWFSSHLLLHVQILFYVPLFLASSTTLVGCPLVRSFVELALTYVVRFIDYVPISYCFKNVMHQVCENV